MSAYRGPNIGAIMRSNTRQFLKRAGEIVTERAKQKIGVYQPGWPPLKPSTLRRKAQRLTHRGNFRFSKPGRSKGQNVSVADMPLLDTGKMRQKVRHDERGFETVISAPFPMQVHEQDPMMDPITPSVHIPPRRPVLVPSLVETLPQIENEALDYLASRF